MLTRSCLCWGILLHLALTSPCSALSPVSLGPPAAVDTDGDGIDDDLEAELGTDPLEKDTDGDGWDDLTELLNGTDPCDPHDFPRSAIVETAGGIPPGNPTIRLKVAELLTARRLSATSTPTGPSAGNDFFLRYYYLPTDLSDLAVEVRRSDLKAGSFLLIWRHRLSWNPLGIEQRYVVSVRRDDGKVVAEWTTPSPAGMAWDYVGLPFSLKPSDEGHQLTLSLTPEGGDHLGYDLADFTAASAGIEADVDRDGIIAPEERPAEGKPLRHWINDDDDMGECQEKADVPGLTSGQADHAHPGIDGLRDLVDFLPVNLNLGRVVSLLKPSEGFRYYVGNPDRAVHAVLTSLTPATAGAIHRDPMIRCYGPKFDGPVTAADVLLPDKDGRIEIPAAFVERIGTLGHGVLLLEGAGPSRRPLRVEIVKAGRLVATLEQPLALVPVESMYRHVNLTRVARDYSGRPATVKHPGRPDQTGEPPGLPDTEANDRWVVLIHGYNVSGDVARGWHAETFKRLHVLGSKARFVGITWNGDTGLDYHRAVYHAFQTGDAVPGALGFLDASRTLLLGHSLGNVVACQAIQAGFTPARYFLLNAALPVESLTGETHDLRQAAEMTEELWRPYERRLFAADWWRLHPSSDQRAGYSWTNAFDRVRLLGVATNCYSSGEDVTNCPREMASASVLATLWSGRAIDYGVWKTQELLKGVGWSRSLAAIAMERSQGGWGFNPSWRGRFVFDGSPRGAGGHYERLTPEEAARLSLAQLLKEPFFRPFDEGWLHQPRPPRPSPLLDSPHVRYDLLARAIPAMTFAAGAVPIALAAPGGVGADYDLENRGRDPGGSWPAEGHGSARTAGRWLHSDYKNVALPYVSPLFLDMIRAGSLR
jgi:hypothetical protein